MTTTGAGKLLRIQQLSAAGRNAAVVAELAALPIPELEQSPPLALLFGIAQGRLGHHHAGKQWVTTALNAARGRGDSAIEARSLNVCGAIAFQEGSIDEAARYFTEGLSEADRRGDRATVGRCSNNLGIIANLRGQYSQAVGCHTRALDSFQHIGHRGGAAETLHNLAINYRDQRAFARALESEERAMTDASAAGDVVLLGLTYCGRGEIRLRMGDVEGGRQDIERAAELHRDAGDSAAETEDLRAMAGALDVLRRPTEAESVLREVLVRARQFARPLLVAQTLRDLARLWHRQKRGGLAVEAARDARTRFGALGAVAEVGRLDFLLREMNS